MTRLLINPGACGMLVQVDVEQKDNKTFSLTVTSECTMVQKLGTTLTELTTMDAFKQLVENPVFIKGAACLKHAACPVPCGILKALEVEAGLNVPRDVTMSFVKDTAG
ncbi:MAG: hypothetical protein EPN25_08310 [Nitrospirae bacterium]|nr:MAG: hypothetical protein EPN25_08310 [Nitrospirota bacterium]